MTGKSHAAIGANTIWIFYLVYGASLSPVIFALAVIGALMPDFDAAESKIKHFKIRVGKKKTGLAFYPFYLPAVIISAFFKHRGFWHSLLATLLVTGISVGTVIYLNTYVMDLTPAHAFALPFGYLSHLLADSLTKFGVPLFWPNKENFHLTPRTLWFKSGGAIDHIIFAVATMGVLFLVLKMGLADGIYLIPIPT